MRGQHYVDLVFDRHVVHLLTTVLDYALPRLHGLVLFRDRLQELHKHLHVDLTQHGLFVGAKVHDSFLQAADLILQLGMFLVHLTLRTVHYLGQKLVV